MALHKTQNFTGTVINDAIIQDIRDSLCELDNGFITIRVQSSKIVQVEITRRTRFDDVWYIEEGGGI